MLYICKDKIKDMSRAGDYIKNHHPDPDSLFQGTDRDKFMHKAICGIMEAYNQSENVKVIEFLNMILNSYKVINTEEDADMVFRSIVFKADELKKELLKYGK
jgi:hypothetical protein